MRDPELHEILSQAASGEIIASDSQPPGQKL
jgi:hypothetical protein